MRDMLQFSVDVEELEEESSLDMERLIKAALEMAGFREVNVSWVARWTHDDYFNGKKPYIST